MVTRFIGLASIILFAACDSPGGGTSSGVPDAGGGDGSSSPPTNCAAYCTQVCAKAIECDVTELSGCTAGCSQEPASCNTAAIAVRSCAQIEAEVCVYVVLVSDDKVLCAASGGAEGDFCTAPTECWNGLGCIAATGTCGSCTDDAECGLSHGQAVCRDGECVEVDCLTDADCPDYAPRCSAELTCGDCAQDAHCPEDEPLCRDGECVLCASDADCPGGVCHQFDGCIECEEDTDCEPAETCYSDHRCHVRCDTDEECRAQGLAECYLDHCTDAFGAPCDPDEVFACGGGRCLNVSAGNLTVEPYCSATCYSADSPCPAGYTCKDSECRQD